MRSANVGLLASVLIVACGGRVADARDQWTVTIATDAPVPQFGDRLLVEVLNERGEPACGGCRRQFGVGDPNQWPISFGVAAPPSGKLSVRARLYRSSATGADGLPAGTLLIDALGHLPPPNGDTPVTLVLSMACLGFQSKPPNITCDGKGEGTLTPLLSASPAPRVGSWAPASTTTCVGANPDNMSCVRGGAFLLGSPSYIATGSFLDPTPERLVQVSAFALDVDELTVGDFRKVASSLTARPTRRGSDPKSAAGACTYLGDGDSTNDSLPLNCISHELAVETCAVLGKRLPTEAEWEWAAGNGALETTYPWGHEDDLCARAIVGRGRTALETDGFEIATCRSAPDGRPLPWGPVAGGSAADISTSGIKNLAGNLAEWVDGGFDGYAANCWSPDQGLLIDPRCSPAQATTPAMRAVRGAHWAAPAHFARVYQRSATLNSDPSPTIGFRCARSVAAD